MRDFRVTVNGQTFTIRASSAQEARQRAAANFGVSEDSVSVGESTFVEETPGGGPSFRPTFPTTPQQDQAPSPSPQQPGGQEPSPTPTPGPTPGDTVPPGIGPQQTGAPVGGTSPQELQQTFTDAASGGTATDPQQAQTFAQQAGFTDTTPTLPSGEEGTPALNPPRQADFRNFLSQLGIDPDFGAFRGQAFDLFRPAQSVFEAQNALTGGGPTRFGDFLGGGIANIGEQARSVLGDLAGVGGGGQIPAELTNILGGTLSEAGPQGFQPLVNIAQGATRGRLNPLVAQGIGQTLLNRFMDQADPTATGQDFASFARQQLGGIF